MIADFYDSTAEVELLTITVSGMGGKKKSYSTRITSLECRVTPRTATEADEFGKLTVREFWRLYCAATATNKAMSESDKVTIGSREWEITGIRNPALLDRHLEIDLRLLK